MVTTDRVIFRSGVFAKHGIEIPLRARQQRELQPGDPRAAASGPATSMIESGGEDGQPTSPTSASPSRSSRSSTSRSRQNRSGGLGDRLRPRTAAAGAAPPRRAGRAAPVERGRRDRQAGDARQGHITQAQFEAQKQKLLGWLSPAPRPRLVVSLVPSVTETLLAWSVRPIAVTRFCEQPELPAVGGTKDPDLAAIVGAGARPRRRERRGEPARGRRRARRPGCGCTSPTSRPWTTSTRASTRWPPRSGRAAGGSASRSCRFRAAGAAGGGAAGRSCRSGGGRG